MANTKLQLVPQAYFRNCSVSDRLYTRSPLSLDKDTVERTILTLKSLYPLTCDTDEKKRAYISAKMPFNIPNTVNDR